MTTAPVTAPAAGYYEPVLHRTYLPRCAHCAAEGVITPHPKAADPTAADICPVCGAPSAAGQTATEHAVITVGGPPMWLAKGMLGLGNFLLKITKG